MYVSKSNTMQEANVTFVEKTFLPKLWGYSYAQNKRQGRLFLKQDDHFQIFSYYNINI